MRPWTRRGRLATLAIILLICGCSGGTDEEASSGPPPVPAHQQTAEALIAHGKMLTDQAVPDMVGFYDLFYWETETQRAYRELMMSMVGPVQELNRSVVERFGPDAVLGGRIEYIPSATLDSNDGQRATSILITDDREEQVLHLVLIDRRWWFSGYSMEYAGEQRAKEMLGDRAALTPTILRQLAKEFAVLSPAFRTIAERVRVGHYASADEVQTAVTAEVTRIMMTTQRP